MSTSSGQTLRRSTSYFTDCRLFFFLPSLGSGCTARSARRGVASMATAARSLRLACGVAHVCYRHSWCTLLHAA